jgi:hypothetical protein
MIFIFASLGSGISNVCIFFVCDHAGEMDITYLYTKDKPLNWNYQTFSYYFGLKYALGSLTLILGSPVLCYFKVPDHAVCLGGIVSKAAGFVLMGCSTTSTMMFFGKQPQIVFIFCSCYRNEGLPMSASTSYKSLFSSNVW